MPLDLNSPAFSMNPGTCFKLQIKIISSSSSKLATESKSIHHVRNRSESNNEVKQICKPKSKPKSKSKIVGAELNSKPKSKTNSKPKSKINSNPIIPPLMNSATTFDTNRKQKKKGFDMMREKAIGERKASCQYRKQSPSPSVNLQSLPFPKAKSRFLSATTRYNSAVYDQFLTVPSSHPSGEPLESCRFGGSMVRRVGPVVLSMQAIKAVAKGFEGTCNFSDCTTANLTKNSRRTRAPYPTNSRCNGDEFTTVNDLDNDRQAEHESGKTSRGMSNEEDMRVDLNDLKAFACFYANSAETRDQAKEK
ncbi:hypothetical protein QQ045_011857 [Rhodiola kirilowii]